MKRLFFLGPSFLLFFLLDCGSKKLLRLFFGNLPAMLSAWFNLFFLLLQIYWTGKCLKWQVESSLRCLGKVEPTQLKLIKCRLLFVQGVLYYDSSQQSLYEGEWFLNMKNGRGFRRYASGNVYQGMWYRDRRHGYGRMQWLDNNNAVYEGDWENGLQVRTKHFQYQLKTPAQS